MKIVTPTTYRAEMLQRYPRAGPWIDDPPECSNCGQAAAALVELVAYDTGFGDEEVFYLCATCLQAALDAVKVAGG